MQIDPKEANTLNGPCIYKRPNFFLLHSQTRIMGSFSFACEPFYTLPLNSTPLEIGKTVRLCIMACKLVQEFSGDLRELRQQLYRAAGTRSMKGLMDQTAHCGMTVYKDQLIIAPSRNGGTRGDQKGFQYLPEEENIVLSLKASDKELGEGVILALEHCR